MSETYTLSDLAGAKRTQLLNDARTGRARVRDKDGQTLVMLPEERLNVLDQFARWSQVQQRLSAIAGQQRVLSVAELGDLAWVRVLDRDDLSEFADELHSALITSLADEDTSLVSEVVSAWRVTARQLEDPLRRAILLNPTHGDDYIEVERPLE